MSLLDDHVVSPDHETWTLVDDPVDETPLWWPENPGELEPAP